MGLLAICWAVGCSSDGPGGGEPPGDGGNGQLPDVSGDEEPPELAGTLEAHNQARAKEGLPPLVWDSNLENIARQWAAGCADDNGDGLIDHNEGRSDEYPTYVGENIFGSSREATGSEATESWMSEEGNYDHGSCSCTGGMCGHYTQVMWRDTERLGCAKANCAGTFGHAIICNYGPGGNVNGACPF